MNTSRGILGFLTIVVFSFFSTDSVSARTPVFVANVKSEGNITKAAAEKKIRDALITVSRVQLEGEGVLEGDGYRFKTTAGVDLKVLLNGNFSPNTKEWLNKNQNVARAVSDVEMTMVKIKFEIDRMWKFDKVGLFFMLAPIPGGREAKGAKLAVQTLKGGAELVAKVGTTAVAAKVSASLVAKQIGVSESKELTGLVKYLVKESETGDAVGNACRKILVNLYKTAGASAKSTEHVLRITSQILKDVRSGLLNISDKATRADVLDDLADLARQAATGSATFAK
ncbi:MAG: hypothetical protein HQM10_20070 [Candidatus Riflebacteria bacterium]|nr:hypothetical protein [Candidatus Riflebacteria bacterium]